MALRLACAVLALALVAPAASARWLPARAITPAGVPVADYAAAADGHGNVHVLLALGHGDRDSARTATLLRPHRGAFGPLMPLDGDAPASAVGFAAGGRGHVVALSESYADERMYARFRGPAAGGFGAREPVPLSPAVVADGRVLLTPDGTAILVATTVADDGPAPGVLATVRTPGGTWSAARRLDSGTDPEINLDAASDADGRVVVAWHQGGTAPGVYVAEREPGGDFGAPTLISAADDIVRDLRVAAGGRGNALVAWESLSRSARRFRVRASVRHAGRPFSRGIVLSAPGAGELAVAVNRRGGALVAYRLSQHRRSHVRAMIYAGRRGWLRSRRLSGLGSAPFAPDAGFSRDGTAFVVWQRFSGRPPVRIEAAVRPPGRRFGRPRTVSPRRVRAPSVPTLAVAPSGEAVVLWRESSARGHPRLHAAGYRRSR